MNRISFAFVKEIVFIPDFTMWLDSLDNPLDMRYNIKGDTS